MKKVVGMYRNQNMHWVGDGFPVKNLFSYDRLGQVISPFLLLDYAAPYEFQPTQEQRGVGSHPHRGFETVTLAYQGAVEHKDSSGGGGIIQAGDVQWMTAGAGIVHEEFHAPDYAAHGGMFEMVQLWVNLPAQDKMTPAQYQAIVAQEIPRIELDEQGSYLRVIAGQYHEQKGVAHTFSPVNVWDGELKIGQAHFMYVPVQHNSLLVVLSGRVRVNDDKLIQDHSLVIFAKDGEAMIKLEAEQNARFLVLTGQPLNEPFQGHGPFVMNDKAEIIQAMHDFNSGQFGQI